MTIKSIYEAEIPDEILDIVKHAVSLAKDDITSVWTDTHKDGFRPTISFICEGIERENLSRLNALEDYLYEIKEAYKEYFFTVEFSDIGQHVLLYSKGGGFTW